MLKPVTKAFMIENASRQPGTPNIFTLSRSASKYNCGISDCVKTNRQVLYFWSIVHQCILNRLSSYSPQASSCISNLPNYLKPGITGGVERYTAGYSRCSCTSAIICLCGCFTFLHGFRITVSSLRAWLLPPHEGLLPVILYAAMLWIRYQRMARSGHFTCTFRCGQFKLYLKTRSQ